MILATTELPREAPPGFQSRDDMSTIPMYPLRFEPIFQYRLWGGRRLADLVAEPLPDDGPIGEAWLLSDRDDHPSKVADGPLKGTTIRQLMEQSPDQLMGKPAGRFRRFPVLLKFLDAHEKLSVQVHPKDSLGDYIPAGETGKTEAWVVLEAGRASRIYAGLKRGTTREDLERALAGRTVADLLASFTPRVGDTVFIRAGTVHSLSDVVVFEVQENSDVTFRLYDWDRVDPRTGKPHSAGRASDGQHRSGASRDWSADAGRARGYAGTARAIVSLRTFLGVAAQRKDTLRRRPGRYAADPGFHRRRRRTATQRRRLSRPPWRCRALAGGGRILHLQPAQCGHSTGSRTPGMIGGCESEFENRPQN